MRISAEFSTFLALTRHTRIPYSIRRQISSKLPYKIDKLVNFSRIRELSGPRIKFVEFLKSRFPETPLASVTSSRSYIPLIPRQFCPVQIRAPENSLIPQIKTAEQHVSVSGVSYTSIVRTVYLLGSTERSVQHERCEIKRQTSAGIVAVYPRDGSSNARLFSAVVKDARRRVTDPVCRSMSILTNRVGGEEVITCVNLCAMHSV